MKTTDYLNDTLTDKAVIFAPGEGEVIHINGVTVTLKVTSTLSNDQLGIYELTLAPRAIGARLHYHRFMDETFMVQQGTLTIQLEGRETAAAAGTVVYIPRFTPHGFYNNTDEEVTVTLLFNPGQNREGFFHGLREVLSEQPVDPDKYLRLYNKYDSFPVDTGNMLPIDADK